MSGTSYRGAPSCGNSLLSGAAAVEVERQERARLQQTGFATVQKEQLRDDCGVLGREGGRRAEVGGGREPWGANTDRNSLDGAYFYGAPGLRPGAKAFDPEHGVDGGLESGEQQESRMAGAFARGYGEEEQEKDYYHQRQKQAGGKHLDRQVHVLEVQMALAIQCGICFELTAKVGRRFGLLTHCEHAFCISCIRKWRSSLVVNERARTTAVAGGGGAATTPEGEVGDAERPALASDEARENVRACPLCRKPSDFVVPSYVRTTC